MINLFYRRKDTDKEYNTQEIQLLRQALRIISMLLRCPGIVYPELGFMAKEKCDAFKCEKLQLFIAVKESRRRDNNCLLIGSKEDGRPFLSLLVDLIMGKG